MADDVVALEARVTRLENQITDGFKRIEELLRHEITDLKSDQLADMRKTNERIADDQRRLWDRLVAMELRDSQRTGGSKAVQAIGHFFSAGMGAIVAWLLAWLSGGGGHHQ